MRQWECRDEASASLSASENEASGAEGGDDELELGIAVGEEYEGVYSPPLTDTEDGPAMTELEYQAMLVCSTLNHGWPD
jgi:hypothetical protein